MATQEKKEEKNEVFSTEGPSHHFVLVHGVGHGAWCWFKLKYLLEGSGHKVTCLDLTGAGINNSDPNSVLSFDEYNKPILDFMSALPQDEKVILVGHSAGGLSVTQATRKFGDKISVAIYVAATMLRSGFSTEEDTKDGIPNISSDKLVLNFGLGPKNPPTSAFIQVKFHHELLYNMSSMEDCALASMLVRPWPLMAITSARFEGGDENVDKVRRVYVKTKYDHMLSPEQQDAMVKRWMPSEVMVIDSDHSPFFSTPSELLLSICKCIIKINGKP